MIGFQDDTLDLLEAPDESLLFDCDEEYLPDDRMELRPSEIVQSKLMCILPRGMAIPISCMHTRRDVRR